MHPDDALWAGCGGREDDQRDGRGVRGQYRLRRGNLVEPVEQPGLDGDILKAGLDHHVGGGHDIEIDPQVHAGECFVGIGPGDLLSPDKALQAAGYPLRRRRCRCVADFYPDDLEAALRRDLGNPSAHRPQTSNSELSHVHGASLLPGLASVVTVRRVAHPAGLRLARRTARASPAANVAVARHPPPVLVRYVRLAVLSQQY